MIDTLGFVYYKKNLPSMAIREFQESIKLSGRNPLYHFHLGLAHAQAGDKASARRAIQEALRLDANFSEAAEARRLLTTLQES